MLLRALSKVLVAAALSGCGGPSDKTTAGAPIAKRTPPDLTRDASPATQIHGDASWRYMPMPEVVDKVMPLGPDDMATYVKTGGWVLVANRCTPACTFKNVKPTTLIVVVTRSGASREYALADALIARDSYAASLGAAAARDPVLQAFDYLATLAFDRFGIWLSRTGATSDALPAELTRDAPRILDRAQADAFNKAVFAAEAAPAGFLPHQDPMSRETAIDYKPLAVGWLVRTTTQPPPGCSDGARPGSTAAVVIGPDVHVLHSKAAMGGHCHGRRPPGFAMPTGDAPADPIARYYVAAAHLEAASVEAFDLLAAELAALGAPVALVERARAASVDEVRHAAFARARAVAAGATLEPTPIGTRRPRDAFAIALDNAVEGCVHEAFAAVVNGFQAAALAARNDDLAHELAAIANDELEHGQLAWDLAAWLEPLLSPDHRDAVESARRYALDSLIVHADQAATGSIGRDIASRHALGLPSPEQAAALARGFAGARRA
ncbi:MAG: hypothetical protein M4D80_09985 [Myxococcota bacterium]|nr:hypothetical protein [Myxococcota bacterium]